MNFQSPSTRMAGFITVVLLGLYGFLLVAPYIFPKLSVTIDPEMKQTLLVLLVGAVGYYIGSSKSSNDKTAALTKDTP